MDSSRDISDQRRHWATRGACHTVLGQLREAGVSWVKISTSSDFDRDRLARCFRTFDDVRRPRRGRTPLRGSFVEATAYRYNMGRTTHDVPSPKPSSEEPYEGTESLPEGLRRSSEPRNRLRKRFRSKSDEVKISTQETPTSRICPGGVW